MARRKFGLVMLLLIVTLGLLVAAGCGGDDESGPAGEAADAPESVVVCELAYYTGGFASFGPFLTAGVQFPIDNVINEDPPLGSTWELINEDAGTDEGQAARTCVEQHGAAIVVSPAHSYQQYRDFMQEWIEENDGPLLPTVHGGTIPQNIGGTGEEPIFRAQGLDEALGMYGVLYADSIGAENIVIFATQVEGYQLASDAAEKTAEELGIEVLARIDAPGEQSSYRAAAEQIADLNPDAVIAQATSIEVATVIKEAAEAGASLHWIGETGLFIPEFLPAVGGAETLNTQKSVGFASFAYNNDNPAWEFYSPLWEDTPGYGDTHGEAGTNYHYSAYDLLVHTALAVEYAGSYKASDWAPAMFEVGNPPGTVCYTYAECLALIRDGEDIDYEGVTGSAIYTPGGVNDVKPSYTPFEDDGMPGDFQLLDVEPEFLAELVPKVTSEAECDDDNVCSWGG